MDAGTLVIKTILDNKDVGKELDKLKQQLKQEEKSLKEFLTYKVQLDTEMGSLEEVEQALKDIAELEKQGLTEVDIEGVGKVDLEQHKQDLIYAKDLYKQINSEIEDSTANIKQLNVAIASEQIKQNIKDIGKEIGKNIKSIGRMGLAIFGIRSAYNAVRNAISVISQGDEKLKADITYMKNVFAYALEPIVRRIIDFAKQLIYYLAYIINMWTKYDIFANANKNIKKATKGAKDLKKQLAGFDEMNILSNTSGGGGVNTTMNLNDFKAPKWLEVIGKYGKTLLPIIGGIVSKLFKLKKLGILIALTGIYKTIKGIIDFIKNPEFQNFIKILEGIATTVIGIGAAIGSWPVLLAGIGTYIVTYLVKNFDKIKEKIKGAKTWLDEHVLKWLKEHLGKVGEFLYIPIEVAIGIVEDLFDGFIGGLKKIIDGIVKIFKGDFIGGIKDIFSGLLSIILTPFKTWYNSIKKWVDDILEWLGLIKKEKNTTLGGGGQGSIGWGGGSGGRAKGGIYYPQLPKLAVGGIVNQPGRGMAYHGATIGERGAEAVVPLTDSQQMELLGATIGRYITVMNTNPIYMNGRLIAKEINRSNAEDDFAFNR